MVVRRWPACPVFHWNFGRALERLVGSGRYWDRRVTSHRQAGSTLHVERQPPDGANHAVGGVEGNLEVTDLK
jgi:hypothetical protein